MEIEENITYNAAARTDAETPRSDTDPNDPPWNNIAAIGVWISSVLFILLIPTFFLLPYLVSIGPPGAESSQLAELARTDPTAIFLQVIAIIPAHLLTVFVAWLVVTRGRKFPFLRTLGWKSGGVRWFHYPLILGAFLVVAAIVGYFIPEQDNDLLRILRSSRNAVYAVALIATFSAPFVEEVVYRGVLYSAFQRTMGVGGAFVAVTLMFAVVHVPQYYPSFSTILLLTLLSMTLTAVRVFSKNLLPCIILHALFNGLQSVFMIIEPFINAAGQPQNASVFDLLK